jgi:hypothetical protein
VWVVHPSNGLFFGTFLANFGEQNYYYFHELMLRGEGGRAVVA